ncbi:MAG: MBL fold metallo-hydrolase [Rhodospirillales bacterium]
MSSFGLPKADNWFAIEWHQDDVLRIWEPHMHRLLRANMFLIKGRDRDLLIDAGMGVASLRAFLKPYLDKPVSLFITHTHVDHVGSAYEFPDDVIMHAAEAEILRSPPCSCSLTFDLYAPDKKADLQRAGFDTRGPLISGLPSLDFDAEAWRLRPAEPTRLVSEGDVIDLGNRAFEVLHLPGHSPGSICLYETQTGMLIGGDVIYDGLLIDTLPESSIEDYVETMRRLQTLPAAVVHGGHRESFGQARLRQFTDGYLAAKG